MSKSSEEYHKYKMAEKHRLGPDKDGNVFTEKWEEELSIAAPLFFKDLADPLIHNKSYTWMDKHAVFQWTTRATEADGTVTETNAAFPAETDASYRAAYNARERWEDKQSRFQEVAPQMISFLINGTLTESSRERLLTVLTKNRSNLLKQIRENNDILLLKRHMITIHDYGGLQVDDKDKQKVQKKFVDLQASRFGHGYNVADHMRVFEELLRKMRTFKIIGNANAADDKFSQTDLYDAFTKPMETHDNPRVRQRLQNIDDEVIAIDKTDPESIHKEFLIISKLEKKELDDGKGGGRKNQQCQCPDRRREDKEKQKQ